MANKFADMSGLAHVGAIVTKPIKLFGAGCYVLDTSIDNSVENVCVGTSKAVEAASKLLVVAAVGITNGTQALANSMMPDGEEFTNTEFDSLYGDNLFRAIRSGKKPEQKPEQKVISE